MSSLQEVFHGYPLSQSIVQPLLPRGQLTRQVDLNLVADSVVLGIAVQSVWHHNACTCEFVKSNFSLQFYSHTCTQ